MCASGCSAGWAPHFISGAAKRACGFSIRGPWNCWIRWIWCRLRALLAVTLPYGRKRALEIATTLAMDPKLMLLDEPTQGMGHEDVERVTALIKKVSANRTVLMVEHNMNVVATIADTITVLQRGSHHRRRHLRRGLAQPARDGSVHGNR